MEWFEAIRERRIELGLSQAQLAKRAGISQGAIDKIEKGKVTFSKFTPIIAESLGLELSALNLVDAFAKHYERGYSNFTRKLDQSNDALTIFMSIEDTSSGLVILQSVHDNVKKPWFVSNSKPSYAIFVEGDSMSPVYMPSDIIIVDTSLPLRRWCSAFIIRDGSEGREGYIRHVLDWTRSERVVAHYQDGVLKEERMPRDGWKEAHRIVGKVEAA